MPSPGGAGQACTDMRTMFTAEHLAAPLASFVHSFPAVTDDSNLALLLHDLGYTLLFSATSNGCTWPQTDVKHT
jgi:hypothetical protein